MVVSRLTSSTGQAWQRSFCDRRSKISRMTILARCAFRAGGRCGRRGVEIFTLNISTPRRPGCAAILTDTSPVPLWAAVSCLRPSERAAREVRHEEGDAVGGRRNAGETSHSSSVQNAFGVWIAEAGARLCPATWLKGRRLAGLPIVCQDLLLFPAIGRRRESENIGQETRNALGLSAADGARGARSFKRSGPSPTALCRTSRPFVAASSGRSDRIN